MDKYFEDNYISVVLTVKNNEETIEKKVLSVLKTLKENFKNYELIIVDNMSSDSTLKKLYAIDERFTIVELPTEHDMQSALTAGVNAAIGDYIVEIENINDIHDFNILMDMYKICQEGNDFVFLAPKRTSFFSKMFYKMLNNNLKHSGIKSDITSSIATLSSRRGQNKTFEVGNKLVNRNVSYILSGLKYQSVIYDYDYKNSRSFSENLNLMFQTMIYYTDAFIKLSQNISLALFFVSVFLIFYSLYFKFFKNAAAGWTSTMIVICMGFSALFLMGGLILRYLYNILKNVSDSKQYNYKSITRK